MSIGTRSQVSRLRVGQDAEYDVVVVGARVAGASTAMLLARAGVRVLLLDRGRPGSETLSTHALMRAGVLQLTRWGLVDEVVAAGTPAVRTVTFRVAGADPMKVTLRPAVGVEALYAPRRRILDRILIEAAGRAGADVRHRTAVTGLVQEDGGRVGGVVTHDGTVYRGRYVVGADGIRSSVAAAIQAPLQVQGAHASALRYTYLSGLHDRGYEWCYGGGAAAGLVPTNDRQHCVFVATSPDRLRALAAGRTPDELFATLLQRAVPDRAARILRARRVERFHGWAGQPGFLRRPWGPGWALVGDAGYYKDPITSHGITDALRDAELLARALLECLGDSPEREVMHRYHRRRDLLAAPMLAAAEDLASYSWTDAGVQPLLRRVSAAMTQDVDVLESLPPLIAPLPAAAAD